MSSCSLGDVIFVVQNLFNLLATVRVATKQQSFMAKVVLLLNTAK